MRCVLCCVAVLGSLFAATSAHRWNRESRTRNADAAETPWVLHAPFDELQHAIVIAVAPRLFVAYDTDTCRFHCAWSGEVEFDGDTATSSAGPTPKRKGAVQSEGGDGIPWETCDRGVFTTCRVRYRGCTFDDDFATLRFELLIDGESHPVLVEETPAILTHAEMDQLWRDWTNDPSGKWSDESGKLRVLRRTFRVHDLPSGAELSLQYQRTVKSVTGWTGFDGQRDLRAVEFETANCVLVEPSVLTFASTTEAQTFELIELP